MMSPKGRKEYRATLTEEDWKIVEEVMEETGLSDRADLIRFCFTRTLKLLKLEPELLKKIKELE